MLNAEKFRKELLELSNQNIAFAVRKENQNPVVRCDSIKRCTDCLFGRGRCSVNSTKWLLSEYKEPVKLTELEHGILEYLLEKRQYRFVVRERSGIIYVYKSKPKKEADSWGSLSLNNELGLFNNLFQFVQWGDSEPISIEDVLNNCEVVNDAEE